MKTDLKIAARTLWKSRRFTALTIGILAIGIALNTSIFAVVNAYLLRSLPYPGSKRLYNIVYSRPGQSNPRGLAALPWHTLGDVIEHSIAWDLDMFYVTGGDYPESAPGTWVTPGFMDGLGIRPAMGRGFSADDFKTGSPQVAIISHSLWQNRYGGDSSIIGRQFHAYVSDRPMEAEMFTIIGVMPAGFWHFNPYTQIMAPLRAPSYPYLARLRAGVPPSEAERRITDLVKAGVASLPADWRVELRSSHGEYVARLRPQLLAVAVTAGLVLLIACANVAFLLLIRATRRQKEIAVRLALGAGRPQIARMLIAEALMLGTAATTAGIALSWFVLKGMAPIAQRQLGRPAPGGTSAISIDGFVVAASMAFCLLIVIVFALAPLAAFWRTNLSGAMHAASRSGAGGRETHRARSVLVALEVAGSFALLAGCGLMIRTVSYMMQVDFGNQPGHVLLASIALRQRSYPEPATRLAFFDRLLPRLQAVPGVLSVSLSNWPALQTPRSVPVEAESKAGLSRLQAGAYTVSPDYYSTLGIALIEGRSLSSKDRIGSEPVVLVSETFARRAWQQASAVGQRIRVSDRDIAIGGEPTPVWRTVIGVVKDVRQSYSDEDLADIYAPILQLPPRFTSLAVKTAGPSSAWYTSLRSALKEIDPEVSLSSPRDLDTLMADQFSRPRFLAWLLASFALLAALLAMVGVYGVISYAVKQREHEIAVRMAVGADSRAVTRLFVRQGLIVIGIGLLAGLGAAAAIGRLLETQLYRVRSTDATTLVMACIAFSAAGLGAVWWPARRASRTDPAIALREQ